MLTSTVLKGSQFHFIFTLPVALWQFGVSLIGLDFLLAIIIDILYTVCEKPLSDTRKHTLGSGEFTLFSDTIW